MMAARLLGAAGLEVTTLLLGAPAALKGDAAQAWQEAGGVRSWRDSCDRYG